MGLFDHDHGLFNILIDLEPYCTKGIPLKLFKTYLPERIQYTAINNEILESLNDSATMSKGGSENPGFRYWLVSFNNIAINLSQYFTNDLNTSILYSCQHAWGTLQLGWQNNLWIAKIAVGLFPLMHATLMSRSNLANSNMCMI